MDTRFGAEITLEGDVVYKLHRPGTDPRALRQRLLVAAENDYLLTPLATDPEPVGDRWRTRWPRVATVLVVPESVPCAEAGEPFAALHGTRRSSGVPVHGCPRRMRCAVETLRTADGAAVIRAAVAGLPRQAWRAGSSDRPKASGAR